MCLMYLMILMFCFMYDLCACHIVAFHVVSVTLFINDFTYSIFSATSANFPQDWVLECERRSVGLFLSACAIDPNWGSQTVVTTDSHCLNITDQHISQRDSSHGGQEMTHLNPVNISWVCAILWEADLYLPLGYKWWLNVGTTEDLTTLGTRAVDHNGTAKNCQSMNVCSIDT